MPFLPLSPLVLGALAVGFLVVTPFCVLMWRAGYNVGWSCLPFAALLLLNVPVAARPTSLVVAAAVYLIALYAFVLTTGKEERERRMAARRARSKNKQWQAANAFSVPTSRPAMAARSAMPAGPTSASPWPAT